MKNFTGIDMVAWDATEAFMETKEATDLLKLAFGNPTEEQKQKYGLAVKKSVKNTLDKIVEAGALFARVAQIMDIEE